MSVPLVEMEEVIERTTTWNPVKSKDRSFKYIDLSSIDQKEKKIAIANELLIAEAPSRARQLVKSGDILVSTVRPNLNAVAPVPADYDMCIASTGFSVLRPNTSKLSGRYLFHWVRSPAFVQDMMRKATGANYPAVSDRIVKGSTIPLPPLREQKRIAAILDKADTLRRKRKETIKLLDSLTLSIFLNTFEDVLKKPSNAQAIGEISQRITKGESPKWQGHNYTNEGALFVTSENVGWGHMTKKAPKFIPLEFHKKLARSQLRPGDLLINLVGASIGRTSIFDAPYEEANINQAVAVVSLNEPLLLNLYVLNFLLSDLGQKQLLGSRVEGARANISLRDVRNICLPLPSHRRIEEFNKRAEAILRKNVQLSAHHNSVETLCASLQHRAFAGDL